MVLCVVLNLVLTSGVGMVLQGVGFLDVDILSMCVAVPVLAVTCVFGTFGCLVVLVIKVVLGQCGLGSEFPWYCFIHRSCKT